MSWPRPSARATASVAAAAGAALLIISLLPSQASAGVAIPGLPGLNPFGDDLFEFGIKEGGKLILALLGGLVDLLLPDEIAKQGASLVQWIGAGPDYGAAFKKVKGINTLLGYSIWLGISILPASIAVAAIRHVLGDGPSISELVSRVIAAAIVLAFWKQIWTTIPLFTSNVTAVYLKSPPVVNGLNEFIELLVTGGAVAAALGAVSWPLLTIVVMGIGGFLFVSLIVMNAALWIIGAAVYIGGPILVGFVVTDRGVAMVRSLGSVIVALIGLPIVWSLVLSVTALTVAGGKALAIALGGPSTAGQIVGAVLIGAAAILGPGMCFWIGKAVLGSVTSSLLTTAKGVTARASGGSGANPAAAPKNAGAGAATVANARRNLTAGWTRGLGGVGPQAASSARMAAQSARKGGLLAGGATIAGALARSAGGAKPGGFAGARRAASASAGSAGASVASKVSSAANKVAPSATPAVAGAAQGAAAAAAGAMGSGMPAGTAVPPRPSAKGMGEQSTAAGAAAATAAGGDRADRANAGAQRQEPSSSTQPPSGRRGAGAAPAAGAASAAAAASTAGAPQPSSGSSAASGKQNSVRPRRDRQPSGNAATPAQPSRQAPRTAEPRAAKPARTASPARERPTRPKQPKTPRKPRPNTEGQA